MNFRVKAFTLHIGASACVIAVTLGSLYLGWYRWPGWYVTGAVGVTGILVVVDLTLGPLFTLLIANPGKLRRVLARDVAVIVTMQLVAFVYGVTTLWAGRPLYYVFWVNQLRVISASRVPADDAALLRQENPDLAPHWYSRPRWVWAPPPDTMPKWLDSPASATTVVRDRPAEDTINKLLSGDPAPRSFQPLAQAGDELRARLRKVDEISIFTRQERQTLKQRMAERGLRSDERDVLFLAGYTRPVLAVFDPADLTVKAVIRAD